MPPDGELPRTKLHGQPRTWRDGYTECYVLCRHPLSAAAYDRSYLTISGNGAFNTRCFALQQKAKPLLRFDGAIERRTMVVTGWLTMLVHM